MKVAISKIHVGERFRKTFDRARLDELKQSMQENGLVQPIAVKRRDDGMFELVAGERRLRAARELGWTEIDAHEVTPEDELEMRVMELVENVQREAMTYSERVELISRIHKLQLERFGEKRFPTDEKGWSIRKTAELLGMPHSQVSVDLKVAEARDVLPEIKKAPSRVDAVKMLKKAGRVAEAEQRAVEIQRKKAETPEDIARKKLLDAYVLGDFFEHVRSIPDDTFDLIECDPPFGINLNEVKRAETGSYQEIDSDEYMDFLERVVDECYRVLKPGRWLIFWFAPEPWFETVYATLTSAGFQTRRLVGEWIKPAGQTNAPNIYLGNASEWFFYARKGPAQLAKPGRLNIFDYRQEPDKFHPTAKPIELYEDLLATFLQPGEGKLLVPFAGSGNALLAGWNLGWEVLGFDRSEEFRALYAERVAKQKPGEFSSFREK